MRNAVALSVFMHLAVVFIAWHGLPTLRRDLPLLDQAIIVDVVDVSEITNAPPPEPKPDEAKPKAKAEPEQKAPEPPKSKRPPPAPEIKQASIPQPPPPQVKAEPVAVPKAPDPVPAPKPKNKPKPVVAPTNPAPKPKPRPRPKHPVAQPKPAAKPQPKPEKKKPKRPDATAQFAKLLKDVEKLKRVDAPTDTDKKKAKPKPKPKVEDRIAAIARSATTSSSTKSFDPNAKLTISELDAVRRQISECWNIPAGAKDAEQLVVDISVQMNRDGTVRYAEVTDGARMRTDPFFRTAAESAMRAVLNPRCSPLKLPPEKYEQWKSFTIGFNPRDVL